MAFGLEENSSDGGYAHIPPIPRHWFAPATAMFPGCPGIATHSNSKSFLFHASRKSPIGTVGKSCHGRPSEKGEPRVEYSVIEPRRAENGLSVLWSATVKE